MTRVHEIYARIIRGLYYKNLNGQRLPDASVFDLRRPSVESAMNRYQLWKQSGPVNGPFVLEKGIFTYAFTLFAGDPSVSQWLLQFYTHIFVLVTTNPPTRQRQVELIQQQE